MTINPLVAARVEGPKDAWAGVWIVEDIELISQGVKNGSWIDGTLGVVGATLDGLALISDPVGALLQYGVAWIIEHVKPLSDALDWLAGDPAQISAHAQTWRNVAESLRADAASVASAVRSDLGDWQGAAADSYRAWSSQQQGSIEGLAKAADAMALVTEGAGFLIAAVRMLVRDAIATLVSRLIVYAAEEVASLGLATPLVVEQVTTLIASWAGKISRWLRGLIKSLRELSPIVRRLGELIDELKRILNRLRGRGRFGGHTGREGGEGVPHGETPHVELPDHFTPADVDKVADHLGRLDHSPANDAMMSRIRDKLAAGQELTEGELNFMKHELTEKALMDRGMSYEEAHEIALGTHPPGRNYDPAVIEEFGHLFNNWWRKQWGLGPK
jgi:uncharacterized protein YukE